MCKVKWKAGTGILLPSKVFPLPWKEAREFQALKSGIQELFGFPKTVQKVGPMLWSRLGCARDRRLCCHRALLRHSACMPGSPCRRVRGKGHGVWHGCRQERCLRCAHVCHTLQGPRQPAASSRGSASACRISAARRPASQQTPPRGQPHRCTPAFSGRAGVAGGGPRLVGLGREPGSVCSLGQGQTDGL